MGEFWCCWKESVLFDLAAHDISMILSITKTIPKDVEVNAIFKNSKKIADYINVILYFEKGYNSHKFWLDKPIQRTQI